MDALARSRQVGAHRRFNLGLLTVGFAVGHGSIFLAQSWLVGTGQLEALAQFGFAFSFAIPGIQLVDAGALTLLARRAAQFAARVVSRAEVERGYWAHTYTRLVLAAAAVAGAGMFLVAFPDRHALAYLGGAWPGMVLWSFNASGILDGLERGGLSGLTGAIAYFTSALVLPLSAGWSEADAGWMQGLAFSAGYLAAVAVQLLVLVPLSFIVAASGLTFALSQGAHASGRHAWVAKANTLGVATGTAVTVALVQGLQLTGVALGNLACQCAAAGARILLFCSRRSHA